MASSATHLALTEAIHEALLKALGKPLTQASPREAYELVIVALGTLSEAMRAAKVSAAAVASLLREVSRRYGERCPCARCAQAVQVNARGGCA